MPMVLIGFGIVRVRLSKVTIASIHHCKKLLLKIFQILYVFHLFFIIVLDL